MIKHACTYHLRTSVFYCSLPNIYILYYDTGLCTHIKEYIDTQNTITTPYLWPSFLVPDETFVFKVEIKHVAFWHNEHQPASIGGLNDRHIIWFFVGKYPVWMDEWMDGYR